MSNWRVGDLALFLGQADDADDQAEALEEGDAVMITGVELGAFQCRVLDERGRPKEDGSEETVFAEELRPLLINAVNKVSGGAA